MPVKCLVIGGGIAGLSAAAFLANQKIHVTLLEASPKLGGRAYSYLDKNTNTIVDNGQHILMGCYNYTLKFLRLINADEKFEYQKKLKVNFVKEGLKVFHLKSFPVFYPFNMLIGLLNYKAISLKDRLRLLKVFIKLPFLESNRESNKSVEDWLIEENQTEAVQEAFWKILTVGAMNTSISKASAKIFIDVLKQIFLHGNFAATIVLPKHSLNESYVQLSADYITSSGGNVLLSEKVNKLKVMEGKIVQVYTENKSYDEFDFVISTVPLFALKKIINEEIVVKHPEFTYSAILNVHLWLNGISLKDSFYGFIGSPVHWVFDKKTHLNVVISDADYLVNKPDEDILKIICPELKKYLDIDESQINHYKIIKEKRATFVPSNDIIDNRPSSKTNIRNLFLAGDWIDTGLPSTIESAVKSGWLAADRVINNLKN